MMFTLNDWLRYQAASVNSNRNCGSNHYMRGGHAKQTANGAILVICKGHKRPCDARVRKFLRVRIEAED